MSDHPEDRTQNAQAHLIEQLTSRIESLEERLLRSDEYSMFLDEAQKASETGCYITDLKTGVWKSTDVMDKIFGIDKDYPHNVEGWVNFMHPDYADAMNEYLTKVLREAIPFDAEYKIIRPSDKRERWMHGLGKVLYDKDGSPISLMGTVRDITDKKEAEVLIFQAKEEAEKASEAKTRFLSSMSHELRTPMNAVLGLTELLITELEDSLTEDQREYFKYIEQGGQTLLYLIEQILDLSSIAQDKVTVTIAPTDIKQVINTALMMVASKAQEKSISLTNDLTEQELPAVLTDKRKVQQILINLLTNAIKYNDIGGSVTISCDLNQEGLIRILVQDNGFGIPEDARERVFLPFDRAGRESGLIEGTGIGLNIVQQLIERLDGHIDFESEEGKGSRFWIELPTTQEQLNTAQNQVHADSLAIGSTIDALNNHTLLYIEDNLANTVYMHAVLKDHQNLRLRTAKSAEVGLEIARNEKIDLILIDIKLPGMSGYDALIELKADPRTQNIPVIAVTAEAYEHQIAAGKKAGFTDYVIKPFSKEKILASLSDTLGNLIKSRGQ